MRPLKQLFTQERSWSEERGGALMGGDKIRLKMINNWLTICNVKESFLCAWGFEKAHSSILMVNTIAARFLQTYLATQNKHPPVAVKRLAGRLRSWAEGRPPPPRGPSVPRPPEPGRRANISLRKSSLCGSACISWERTVVSQCNDHSFFNKHGQLDQYLLFLGDELITSDNVWDASVVKLKWEILSTYLIKITIDRIRLNCSKKIN